MIFSFLISCTEAPQETYFLTKLGNDTLAIERFEVLDKRLVADMILRSSVSSLKKYKMSWDSEYQLSEMKVIDFTELNKFGQNKGQLVHCIIDAGDSLEVTYYRDNGNAVQKAARQEQLIPFLDMVHWPYA